MDKELEALRDSVTCDNCGFRYGAEHTIFPPTKEEPGRYACPVCSETRLEKQVAELRKLVLLARNWIEPVVRGFGLEGPHPVLDQLDQVLGMREGGEQL